MTQFGEVVIITLIIQLTRWESRPLRKHIVVNTTRIFQSWSLILRNKTKNKRSEVIPDKVWQINCLNYYHMEVGVGDEGRWDAVMERTSQKQVAWYQVGSSLSSIIPRGTLSLLDRTRSVWAGHVAIHADRATQLFLLRPNSAALNHDRIFLLLLSAGRQERRNWTTYFGFVRCVENSSAWFIDVAIVSQFV